jgi:signal transduction histidine kinase
MHNKESFPHVIDFLPLTVGLWLTYLLSLAIIDHTLYPDPVLPTPYFVINGATGLIALVCVLLLRKYDLLQTRILVPLVIVCISVVPVLTESIVLMPPSTPANRSGTEGLTPHQVILHLVPGRNPASIMLRQVPLLLMGLILTAWQYGWYFVLLFNAIIATLTIAIHLYYSPPNAPLEPPMVILLIQTISFLVVGYFISVLMRRLNEQHTQLQEANTQLTTYATTLEDLTISRERNRMARELHDTLAHTLSGLSVQLEAIKAYWNIDTEKAQQLLDTSLKATRAGLQETRRALKSLRAAPIEDLGLLLALRQVVTETAERANLYLKLSLPEQLPPLSPAVEQCIYRLVQEAVANVAYHANARNVFVEMKMSCGVLIQVTDDGQGFDPQQIVGNGHFGLKGMQERADLIGAELSIDSRLGQGTTIRLHIKEHDI